MWRMVKVAKGSFLILMLFALVTCAPGALAQVEIEVWHSMPAGAATEIWRQLVDRFNEQNPDIIVRDINVGGYTTGYEKAVVAWAGGAPPNIMHLEQARNTTFIDEGLVLPLEPFIEKDPTFPEDDFIPTMRNVFTYDRDGRLDGIPFNTSTPVNYIRRDLFEQAGLDPDRPPRTWEEILEFSRKLTRDTNNDGDPDTFGTSFYSWGWMFEAWLGQNGGRVLNEDGTRFLLNSPEAIGMLEFTQKLVHEHRVADYGGGASYFYVGRVAMTEGSTASLQNHIRQAEDLGYSLGVAPLACNVECYAPIGGGGFVIFDTGTAEQKEASWRFLSYLSSPEVYAEFAKGTGYMVARRSAFEELQDYFLEEPRARVTYDQIDYAYPRPQVPFWETMHGYYGKIYQVQMVQNGDFRPVLEEATQVGNQLLAEWLEKRAQRDR